MPTFQQTFASCPFPEGVLAALGSYPVQVRVHKAQRAMEAIVSGAAVPQEILAQAADCLKQTLGLNAAAVAVDEAKASLPEPAVERKAPAPKSLCRRTSPRIRSSRLPPKRRSPRGWRPRWRPCAER